MTELKRSELENAFQKRQTYFLQYSIGILIVAKLISILILKNNKNCNFELKKDNKINLNSIFILLLFIFILFIVLIFFVYKKIDQINQSSEFVKIPEVEQFDKKGLNCKVLQNQPDVCTIRTGLDLTEIDCIPLDFFEIFVERTKKFDQIPKLNNPTKLIIKSLFPKSYEPIFFGNSNFSYNYDVVKFETIEKVISEIVKGQTENDKKRFFAISKLDGTKNANDTKNATLEVGLVDKGFAVGSEPYNLCPNYDPEFPDSIPINCPERQTRQIFIPTWYSRNANWNNENLCSSFKN